MLNKKCSRAECNVSVITSFENLASAYVCLCVCVAITFTIVYLAYQLHLHFAL